MKKIISVLMALVLMLGATVFAFGAEPDKENLDKLFVAGQGPEVNGYSLDYMAYSPVKDGDTTKYPLVVWLHGMGDGAYPGNQIEKSNISTWASDEMQSRFKGTEGAFIFAARSLEENKLYWTTELILPLKAAIDSYIEENKDNIDLTRIYIGGYSMGGKMTIRMASMYPEFFAAAFPLCPAIDASDEVIDSLKDMPIWIAASKLDVIAGYNTFTKADWEKICEKTNRPDDCRISVFGRVCYPDGKKTSSNHHIWFAANNDFFTFENGDYYNMTTYDTKGNVIKLEYPNGLISWVSSYSSDYNGEPLEAGTTFSTEKESVVKTFGLKSIALILKAVMMFPVEWVLGLFA